MIVKEFLTQRLAPLQARSCPLWKIADEGGKLRLRPDDLPKEELNKVLRLLVGKDQGCPPDTHLPVYRRLYGEKITAAMPAFNERGLIPLAPTGPQAPR